MLFDDEYVVETSALTTRPTRRSIPEAIPSLEDRELLRYRPQGG